MGRTSFAIFSRAMSLDSAGVPPCIAWELMRSSTMGYPSNSLRISSMLIPMPCRKTITGTFLRLSTLMSNLPDLLISNSSHAPLEGMILPLKTSLSFSASAALPRSKYTPGLLTSWETTTLSAPEIIKVP